MLSHIKTSSPYRHLTILIILLGILISAASSAAEKPMKIDHDNAAFTLTECVRISLKNNPVMRIGKENVFSAGEEIGEMKAPYYPEVSLQSGFKRWQTHAFLPSGLSRPDIPTVIGPTDDWSAGLQARLLLFDSGLRKARLERSKAKFGEAQEDNQRLRQELILSVHKSFFALEAAYQADSVSRRSLERANEHLRLAKIRHDAGAVPQADVIKAKVQVAQAELSLVRAKNMVRIAQGGLNTAMGLPVGRSTRVRPESAKLIFEPQVDLALMLKQAEHQRPVVKAAVQRIIAAEQNVNAAESKWGPVIRAEGGYGWRDDELAPHDEAWSAGIVLELPIFTGFARTHGVAKNRAELRKAEADRDRIINQVREEVWASISNSREAKEAVQAARVLVVEANEDLRTSRERYSVGAGTITDLIDSETSLAKAEGNAVEAKWNLHTADSQLKYSLGKLTQ